MDERKKVIFSLLTTLFLFFSAHKTVKADLATKVDVRVGISVCGNGVREGGEDCDGVDLGNKSCTDLGYKGGGLGCNISCDYDTGNCTGKDDRGSEKPKEKAEKKLPGFLSTFDVNGDNQIGKGEVFEVVKIWVESWRGGAKKCDVNKDGKCDLRDLSVILYYTQR